MTTCTILRPYQPPEGGGVVVEIRQKGEAWTVTRIVPKGTSQIGTTRGIDTALYLLIRAYRDGVTTRRLIEHVGIKVVHMHLRRLVDVGKVSRTKGGGWVEASSRLAIEGTGWRNKGGSDNSDVLLTRAGGGVDTSTGCFFATGTRSKR